MEKTPLLTVYNASAGSGKTYTLVKAYLKILFQSKYKEPYKQILAITFTNKAVNEMKQRIIETLKRFSESNILVQPLPMLNDISEELDLEPEYLVKKSKQLLNSILHNYAAFDISTIDGFTHRIIRTFAYDLKLPLNFEVELDQNALLNEAVDSLIAKAGTNASLTKILVDFAIEKADDDKSWDLSLDFNKTAKLLVSENDAFYIEALKDKNLQDFEKLKNLLRTEIQETENNIVKTSQDTLNLLEEAQLDINDFSRGSLPKHFVNLSKQNFDIKFDSKWQLDLQEGKTLYPTRVSAEVASAIESIQSKLLEAYEDTKKMVFHLKFLKAFYKNITPLSVLNAINNELELIKQTQNKMLISEFNGIISKEIKNQPAPFIYERIGEKFKHYFIDEFQDTSVMQWENLIPLLENSLSSAGGSTMLVGDAKQAIYRWRGGKAEQFIKLFEQNNPFPAQKIVQTLPANYRSYKEIVKFNNTFFKYLSGTVFSSDTYKNLYNQSAQQITVKDDGYVELTFLDLNKDDDRDHIFPEHTHKTIMSCLERGFNLSDICVIVRKKKEGVAIANYLSQQNIAIISSETLLIQNAPEVQFINNILALLVKPENNEIKIKTLDFLANFLNIEDKHEFFIKHLSLSIDELFKSLEHHNFFINRIDLLMLPLYDLTEAIIRAFQLVTSSNAYIQFYLDCVFDFSQKNGSDILSFLDYFDKKKGDLSIISPVGQNAVNIMTIHKSKGLEFPIVILPYADLDIYQSIEPKVWYELDPIKYGGFQHTLLNYNRDFENLSNQGYKIYKSFNSQQELDNINLLYVALTRAVEQLYIITKKETSSKNSRQSSKYSSLLKDYLFHLNMWDEAQSIYSFGNPNKSSIEEETKTDTVLENKFISTQKEEHNIKMITKSGLLWDTVQSEAIEKGNLVHNIMADIFTQKDVDLVLNDFIQQSIITKTQASALKILVEQIINHPKLNLYFSNSHTVYNERDIISKDGVILRPDKLILSLDKKAIILDYKTGAEDKSHKQQLILYQDVLEKMGYTVSKKLLVYIDKDITVIEF